MTVENRKGGFVGGDEGSRDPFPAGMRVLAVDDDPACLKILETLLMRCKYHVTTTNQAITALNMLRENRNKFDLVISDVNMPDMDGFKLLELVGLEMDIPVIMLSAYSDPELVLKGVTHGAVDYLCKPVRIEELKNIWQHVVRRKKLEQMDQHKSLRNVGDHTVTKEGGHATSVGTDSDLNGKVSRKRNDPNEEEEDGGEENGHENDDSGSQKKPRVVWSPDLHRKFVAAVNQLGLARAVPKKILDLMNVEVLTRENVASHLQKYRLYLKRISNVASQANLVAALGSKDPSYMRYGSFDGYEDFRAFTGLGKLSTTSPSSYSYNGMLGRLNTPTGLGFRGISSSGLSQPNQLQNSGGSTDYMGQLQSQGAINPVSNLFGGVPTKLEVNQMHLQNKLISYQELKAEDPVTSRLANKLTNQPMTTTSSSGNSSLVTVMSSHFLQKNRIKPSVQMGGLHFEPVDAGSSDIMDQSQCSDIWNVCTAQNSKPSPINIPMPLSSPLNNFQLPLNGNFPLSTSSVRDSHIDFSSNAVSGCNDDSRHDIACQGGLVGTSNYTVQTVDYGQSSRSAQSVTPAGGFVGQDIDHQGTAFCNRSSDIPSGVQLSPAVIPADVLNLKGGISSFDSNLRSDNYLPEQSKIQEDEFFQGPFEPLDELMNAVIKREYNDGVLLDGDWWLAGIAVSVLPKVLRTVLNSHALPTG
ncbi:hypothetical protein SAY86_016783 [Trapa natans]|uniref:Two-component response regulator n=1 Tax=Trapa natans TaxID=22666 RepID=A0AAN7LR26_TRANT|nr:hypothetical protein SAY86_016783 [Trapa natans]